MVAHRPFLAGAGESFGKLTAQYLNRLNPEKGIRWDDCLTLFFICRIGICPRVQVRCSSVAGRTAMETQSPMRGRSPRHRKACAGVYFNGFLPQPCQGWLPQEVNWKNCQRDSSCLAQGEACIDQAGRGMRAETNSIEWEAKANCGWHCEFLVQSGLILTPLRRWLTMSLWRLHPHWKWECASNMALWWSLANSIFTTLRL